MYGNDTKDANKIAINDDNNLDIINLKVVYILNGNIHFFINDQTFKLINGDIAIIYNKIKYIAKKEDNNTKIIEISIPFNMINTSSAQFDIGKYLNRFPLKDSDKLNESYGFLIYRTNINSFLFSIVNTIITSLIKEDDDIKLKGLKTILNLFMEFKEYFIYPIPSFDKDSNFKIRVLEEIENNIQKITLNDLSKKLGLTIEYASRKIKNTFGKNFSEILKNKRIEEAEKLLAKTNISVSEIIREIGYENKSFFHKEFKKVYGVTPLKWRQINKK